MGDTPSEAGDYYKDLEPYFLAIGKLAVSWNRLQDRMALLFTALHEPLNPDIPLGVWYTAKSDRGQREMLKAAAAGRFQYDVLRDFPRALEDILWLANRVEALEDQRNDALHAPLGVGIDAAAKKFAMVAWTAMGNPRANKLKGKKLLDEFAWYLETADALSHFCDLLHASIAFFRHPDASSFPWPEKPKLPNLVLSRTPKANRPQGVEKEHQHPPQPSPASPPKRSNRPGVRERRAKKAQETEK